MASSALRLVRVLAPLTMAAAFAAGAFPAFAQTAETPAPCGALQFELSNPSPGSAVNGNLVITGIAMDTNAPGGASGVDRVDFFLGPRDEGGAIIGMAVPASANDFLTPAPFGPGSFQATISIPDNVTGGRNLVAYAHDSMTGLTGIISMPIAIGQDPQVAFSHNTPTTLVQSCVAPGGGPSTTTTTTTSPPVSSPPTGGSTTTTTTTVTRPASARTIALSVGNPSPGNTILVGAYQMQGTAVDTAATSGSGIDRIDIFLGNRDLGGVSLGQAKLQDNNVWTATVDIPRNMTGLQTIWVYAHSSVSNQSTAVTVPVTTMR